MEEGGAYKTAVQFFAYTELILELPNSNCFFYTICLQIYLTMGHDLCVKKV